MKSLKPVLIKKVGKSEREKRVLLGLVEYYIQTGKPVGSNTLKEAGFKDLSSATIRNYFAILEEQGYLVQSHASGGRIPTHLAYRIYAQSFYSTKEIIKEDLFASIEAFESKEIALLLQNGAEQLSQESKCAIFLSAPRFDQDFITDIKLIALDHYRCLSIVISDFGTVTTEVIYLQKKLSSFAIKRIESYFQMRLTGVGNCDHLENDEKEIAQKIYHELLLRYVVGYSNFIDDDLYRTGFSRLLNYSDFQETNTLASGLTLFENTSQMRLLLKEGKLAKKIQFWIGDDLKSYANASINCAVITAPYFINQAPVGAVGILGPTRLPYRTLFNLIHDFTKCLSKTLTRLVYKFKISFREPKNDQSEPKLNQTQLMLLEDNRNQQKDLKGEMKSCLIKKKK